MARSNAMFYTGGKTIKNCHKSIIDEQKPVIKVQV